MLIPSREGSGRLNGNWPLAFRVTPLGRLGRGSVPAQDGVGLSERHGSVYASRALNSRVRKSIICAISIIYWSKGAAVSIAAAQPTVNFVPRTMTGLDLLRRENLCGQILRLTYSCIDSLTCLMRCQPKPVHRRIIQQMGSRNIYSLTQESTSTEMVVGRSNVAFCTPLNLNLIDTIQTRQEIYVSLKPPRRSSGKVVCSRRGIG